MNKIRIDTLIVNKGLCQSRQKAQALIMAGQVFANNIKVIKSSEQYTEDTFIEIKSKKIEYVGRGALKLEKAINVFSADIKDKVCMDIGAATGGFTDVLLRNGAKHVYSIDVGYGQFDWNLRNDSRVTLMERTNARYLTKDMFEEIPEIAVMDVSFISVKLILPCLFDIMGDNAKAYILIKPQFEAGKENIGKNGVVRDKQVHIDVIKGIFEYLKNIGIIITALDYSPIKGPKGNIEFICEIQKTKESLNTEIADEYIISVVEKSHKEI